MYLEFFRFKEPPFRLSPDPRFFFFSEKHEEAFSHIIYGLKEGNGFIVITGEVGTGKTTLCRLLLSKIEPSVRTALLFNTQLSTLELLQGINQEFGLKWRSRSKKILLDGLNHFLTDLASKGGQALLIIDEAQLLSVECLEEIRLLSNLETEKNKLIQILLIGQPELNAKLEMTELRQLKQRISLRCEIRPLDRSETAAYIKARVQVASGEDAVLFDPKGVDLIYRFSSGFPRLINVIADRSLLAAFVASKEYVTTSHVRQAIHDLEGRLDVPKHETDQKYTAMIQDLKKWLLENKKRVIWGASGGVLFIILLWVAFLWRDPKPELKGATSVPADQESFARAMAMRFDETGIFRVDNISDTTRAAYLTLLNLWVSIASEPRWISAGMEDLFQWMEENRLQSYSVPLEINKILSLDYPVIFSAAKEGGVHYQVLSKVMGEEAIVLDPLAGKKRIPLHQLAQEWKGSGIIIWKELEGVRLPLSTSGSGSSPSIRKIQEALQKGGLFPSPIDGIWTPLFSKALRFYQQREGLEENGFFGPEVHLVLAKRTNKQSPTLQ